MKISSLIMSATATIWFVAIITVWSEKSEPLKTYLASLTGHHWVTKSVLSLVLFCLLYFVLPERKLDVKREVNITILSAILGGAVIFMFYTLHFLGYL